MQVYPTELPLEEVGGQARLPVYAQHLLQPQVHQPRSVLDGWSPHPIWGDDEEL